MHSATTMGSSALLPTPTPQVSLQLANSDQQKFGKLDLNQLAQMMVVVAVFGR
jgi:hypothetical protein